MPGNSSPSWEQRQEQRRAERILARMPLFEELAAAYEKAPALQRSFALRYRRVIGVDPSQRQVFRDALERIRDGGGMPVQDVIAALEQR